MKLLEVRTQKQVDEICEILGWDCKKVLATGRPHYDMRLSDLEVFNLVLQNQWGTLFPSEREKISQILEASNG